MANKNKIITPQIPYIYTPKGEKVSLSPRDNLLRDFLRKNKGAKPPTKKKEQPAK